MHDDEQSAANGLEGAHRVRSHRLTWLAVLFVAGTIGLAACGGPSTPHVASVGKSSRGNNGGGTTTTQPTGNATALLNAWADCMRHHGDPRQADPTIDANNVIHISWNPATPGGYNGTYKGGQGNSGPGQYCRNYLGEAQSALGNGGTQPGPSQAQLVKVAQCMRANGIPDFPDPLNGTLSFNLGESGDLNPNNPTFQAAARLCSKKTGVNLPGAGGSPPPGTIELNGGSPLAGPGGSANG